MKRANLLKIVSVVMVVAMMMFNTTGVFAALTAVQSTTDTTVNISGEYPNAAPYSTDVTVIVLRPGVTQSDIMTMITSGVWDTTLVAGATQAVVQADGSYECNVTLEDNNVTTPLGDYKVIVYPSAGISPTATPETTSFYFAATDDKIVIFKDIISQTNVSNFVTKLERNKAVLGVDSATMWDAIAPTPGRSDYRDDASAVIINRIASYRDNIANVTLQDLPAVLNIIAEETYAQAVANSIETDLDEIDDYADISEYKAKLVTTKMTQTGIDAVTSNVVGSGVGNFEALVELYKQQVVLQGVTKPANNSTTLTREFLDSFAVDVGLTNAAKYTSLSDMQKQSVSETCRTSGATTYARLDEVFEDALEPLTPPATPDPNNPGIGPGAGPGAGPGGGGDGGSTTTVVTPPIATPGNKLYNDIDDHKWAWEAIEALTENAILAGYDNGSFAPNNSILREEFIKVVAVGLLGADAIDLSKTPSFKDARTGWYAPYVAAAEENGITSGTGYGLFGTGREITREDMALMLYRMLSDTDIAINTQPYAFTDASDISDYATEAVYALKNLGIINGDPDGSFRPKGSTTRAEAAVLIFKTLDKLGKIVRK